MYQSVIDILTSILNALNLSVSNFWAVFALKEHKPQKIQTMKSKLFAFCFLLLGTSITVSAQNEFAFGLKAGLTTAALEGHELEVSGEGASNLFAELGEADYGFQGGLFLRIPLGERLFIQPEGTFNTSQATFRFEDVGAGEVTVFRERYNHLNLPLLFGLSLGALKFQAGPVGHLYFDEGESVFSGAGWESALDEFSIGYALGGALDIGKFTLDLRYDGNFGRFGQTVTVGDQTFAVDQAAKRWVATIGYRF